MFRGAPGAGFNLHSYLTHFDGRFWAAWSSAAVGEEDPDQHVVYATSHEGLRWSTPRTQASDPDGAAGAQRWIARGPYQEGGGLWAIYSTNKEDFEISSFRLKDLPGAK